MEILKSTTPTVYYDDKIGRVATAATLKVYGPDGKVDQTIVATVPTDSSTIQAGTTTSSLILASSDGFGAGRLCKIRDLGVDYVAKVASVDSNTINLAAALPVTPATGATVSALRMSATIAAITDVGTYRFEWNITDAEGSRTATQQVYVVNWMFDSPIAAIDVAEVIALTYGEQRQDVFCEHVVERVNNKIRRHLASTGRRPYLYGSSDLFKEAATTCIHWVLAESGFAPAGADISEWIRQMRIQFDQEIKQVISSMEVYDTDADGEFSADERKPHYWTVQTRR